MTTFDARLFAIGVFAFIYFDSLKDLYTIEMKNLQVKLFSKYKEKFIIK